MQSVEKQIERSIKSKPTGSLILPDYYCIKFTTRRRNVIYQTV